jgi:hypothetical protein
MFRRTAFAALIAAGALAGTAGAQTAPREAPPAAFARAVQCRTIADAQQRLACYDREVAALEQAERTAEIRVVDRQQVRRTRRTLFGLDLPDVDLFGGGDDDAVSEVNSTLRSVTQTGLGKWIFELEDGARWVQIDSLNISPDPRAGHTIRIRRGAIGSFLANVNGRRAVRVRRQN